MHRRHFLTTVAAAATLPAAASAVPAPLDFAPGVLEDQMQAGRTVVLGFWASWSLTCRMQRDMLAELFVEMPALESDVTFIEVDWDTYGPSRMAEKMKIPRRSTLVVMKDGRELGRLVAERRPERIRDLMSVALNAAQARG